MSCQIHLFFLTNCQPTLRISEANYFVSPFLHLLKWWFLHRFDNCGRSHTSEPTFHNLNLMAFKNQYKITNCELLHHAGWHSKWKAAMSAKTTDKNRRSRSLILGQHAGTKHWWNWENLNSVAYGHIKESFRKIIVKIKLPTKTPVNTS